MAKNDYILVEVAYARPDSQMIIPLEVAQGTTLREAIDQSRIRDYYPEIDPDLAKTGIFGKLAKPDTVLREKDRVEIYRPLVGDPKEIRRLRAKGKKAGKDGAATGSAAD